MYVRKTKGKGKKGNAAASGSPKVTKTDRTKDGP